MYKGEIIGIILFSITILHNRLWLVVCHFYINLLLFPYHSRFVISKLLQRCSTKKCGPKYFIIQDRVCQKLNNAWYTPQSTSKFTSFDLVYVWTHNLISKVSHGVCLLVWAKSQINRTSLSKNNKMYQVHMKQEAKA